MSGTEAEVLYRLLYDALGAQGRRELLFGSCGELALGAFRSCAVGSRMPLVYFELPLLGPPRFDMQVCLNRVDVLGACELPATAPNVLDPLLHWLRGSDDCVGVDLAFDVSAGDSRVSQVMALMRDGSLRDADRFFQVAGDPCAVSRFRKRVRAVPAGWKTWYVGFAGGRPGHPVRLDFIVSPKVQQDYLQGARSFADDLLALGYKASTAQLEYCRELLGLPFIPNLQLDVMDDDTMGPVLGYNLSIPHWGPARSRDELACGALEHSFSLVEKWELADSRWRQIAGCCIGAAFKVPDSCAMRHVAIRSAPTFLKVRMTPERLLDAKVYLMCAVNDYEPALA